jgi:molecular chaperone GrpE
MKIPINTEDEGKQENEVAMNGTPGDDKSGAAEQQNGASKIHSAAAPDPQPAPAGSDVEKLVKQNNEYLDHLRRLQAEFENYKKRTKKEKADTIHYANGQMAEKLLAAVDNLQRGLKCSADTPAGEEILNGMRMVERQILEILADYGVKPFDTVGIVFDPNIHHPLYTVEKSDVDDNIIVEEIEKGYMLHDKLLRPAKVVVNRTQTES